MPDLGTLLAPAGMRRTVAEGGSQRFAGGVYHALAALAAATGGRSS
jgi:hypothetical protein